MRKSITDIQTLRMNKNWITKSNNRLILNYIMAFAYTVKYIWAFFLSKSLSAWPHAPVSFCGLLNEMNISISMSMHSPVKYSFDCVTLLAEERAVQKNTMQSSVSCSNHSMLQFQKCNKTLTKTQWRLPIQLPLQSWIQFAYMRLTVNAGKIRSVCDLRLYERNTTKKYNVTMYS